MKQLTTWLTVNMKLDFSELSTFSLFGITNLLISYTNQLMDKHVEKYRQKKFIFSIFIHEQF